MSKKYNIGYGKPPKEQQFKKGISGNPNGWPKGSKNTYKLLEEILNQQLEITENGKQYKLSKKAAMLMQIVNEAVKGNIKAIRTLLPYMVTTDIKEDEKEQILESLSVDD